MTKQELEKLLSELFQLIEKKGYQNYQDKKTIEVIGAILTYFESVKYSQDKLIEDLRYAWDSYMIKEQQEKNQYESFKQWYTKHAKNGN